MGVAVATFLGEGPALVTYLAVMVRYATRLLRQGLFSKSHADMCRLSDPGIRQGYCFRQQILCRQSRSYQAVRG